MGKKKKHNHKRWDDSYKKKKNKQKVDYRSRAELLLSAYPEAILNLWFGDNEEERQKFSFWLLEQEQYVDDSALDILHGDDDEEYEKKIRKLRRKECTSMNDMLIRLDEIRWAKEKKHKGKKLKKKLRKKDLGIATYMDSSRYRKSYLSNDEYRKSLKKLAERERREEKEMRKLGYIRSIDPDKELKKILKANEAMTSVLSDAYVQKHYLND